MNWPTIAWGLQLSQEPKSIEKTVGSASQAHLGALQHHHSHLQHAVFMLLTLTLALALLTLNLTLMLLTLAAHTDAAFQSPFAPASELQLLVPLMPALLLCPQTLKHLILLHRSLGKHILKGALCCCS